MKIVKYLMLILVVISPDILSQDYDTLTVNVNKIVLPLQNNGAIGEYYLHPNTYRPRFENKIFFSTGGLYLSGIKNDIIWSNGVFPAAFMEDYLPGVVGSDAKDPENKFYILKATDIPFGNSWLEWTSAVQQGAKFYDGNNDGVYSPEDLNGNGEWDTNEDRPDLLGDFTVFYVFNDSKPSSERQFIKDVSPMGIEVKQTIFALDSIDNGLLGNTIFIRYVIENKGTVFDTLESVYLGIATDPDIGCYYDDFAGCDTMNIGFVYNDGPDDVPDCEEEIYGENPPAFIADLLQGPQTFIPGVTFIDIDGNNKYDEGIDIPKDTAVIHDGPILGKKYIPGAMNLNVTAFTPHTSSLPGFTNPKTKESLRNYLIGGKYENGEPITVSDFYLGNGESLGLEANLIPPQFVFSGDPVNETGWLSVRNADYRAVLCSGPFDLIVNQPIVIVAAYIVGRGTDHLNSITVAKDISRVVKEYYDSNFSQIPVNVHTGKVEIIEEYKLLQNYPNPFNSSTTVKYELPKKGNVVLKVFDILGNEVAVLVNESKDEGKYTLRFDAESINRQISSGLYIYTIRVGDFSASRKMILLR